MQSIEDDTGRVVEGTQASEVAAQSLNDLSAKLAALTERYRVGS
jgi:hypothetical protein